MSVYLTDCPFEIKPREKFLDIMGRENGYHESDEEWLKDNIEACVWFLETMNQLREDWIFLKRRLTPSTLSFKRNA